MVHQVIVHIISPEPRQFLVEKAVQPCPAADKILRKFCGNIYNLSENARVFKHGMNRSIYTAGSLLLFLRLCIIIPTKDDVGGIHRK